MNETKTMMVHRKDVIHCSCANAHYLPHQFSDTNVTSHAFQQISDWKIFLKCFRGPLKTLWLATCGPRACSWTTLLYRKLATRI